MSNYQGLFNELEKNGIKVTEDQKMRIEEKINLKLSYQPRIGIFGKTGVGKSSLCNALFGQDISPVSDVEACTRETQDILLKIGSNDKGLKLIDVPGVGENETRDIEYAKLYQKLLPELDVVIWLLKGDDRAFSTDEAFYKGVVKPHLDQGKPFFIVLNQVDKIEPYREWDVENSKPGPKQFRNIDEKINYVSNVFDFPKSKIIAVSANENYNLVSLVDEIVFALPNDKKLTFVKTVEKEFVSEKAKIEAEKGFFEVVDEFCEEYIPAYKLAKAGVKVVVEGVKSFCGWVGSWF